MAKKKKAAKKINRKKKPAKKRASKYDPKLSVNASFIEIIKAAVGRKQE
jgi:hypothetical protein